MLFSRYFEAVMVRSCVAFAVLVSFSGVVYADEPQGPTASAEDIVDIAKRAQFDTLVMKGDQERARGRLTEAATAYAEALAVRREPLIAGRLGVLLVQIGRLQDAPDLLMDALHRDVEATPEERLAFLKAHPRSIEGVKIGRVLCPINELNRALCLHRFGDWRSILKWSTRLPPEARLRFLRVPCHHGGEESPCEMISPSTFSTHAMPCACSPGRMFHFGTRVPGQKEGESHLPQQAPSARDDESQPAERASPPSERLSQFARVKAGARARLVAGCERGSSHRQGES